MTREIKLSLILGFAIVLVVGVLLSDHFSGARQASLESVDPLQAVSVTPVAETAAPIAGVPMPGNSIAGAPGLVLVDEQGRVQPPPAASIPTTGPVSTPVGAPPATNVDQIASGAQPQDNLVDRLRQRLAGEFTGAVDDLQNGQVPQGAFAIDENRPTPVEPIRPAPVVAIDILSGSSTVNNGAAPERAPQRDAGFRLYTVKEGDTLWSIAASQLGDGRRHKELMAANKGRLGNNGQIRVGASLRIPSEGASKAEPVRTAEAKSSKSTKAEPQASSKSGKKVTKYQVKSGDTLSKIAAKTLGSASRYDDILLANADTLKDEDSLEVGMTLDIPAR